MNKIINWQFEHKFFNVVVSLLLFFIGLWALPRLKLDAIPDLSDKQVILQVVYDGQPPKIVEDQVTYPLTTKMLSLPKAKSVRGYSFFGLALISILFEDNTDLYWARSRVLEQINSSQSFLPAGVKLSLGPDATSIGWVYEYVLKDTTGTLTLADLRDIQDFFLRYELSSIKGVSEVATMGGFKRQFQVEVNPDLLLQYSITPMDIETALKRSNMEIGAGWFQQAETNYMVLSKGYLKSIEDIKLIPLKDIGQGSVLRLGDIAYIKEGPDMRLGLIDFNGEGETVGAVVIMRQSEDVVTVVNSIKQKLEVLKGSLPKGVIVETAYDRSTIIKNSVSNLIYKLLEELLFVAFILILFLAHTRSVFVAMILLPLCMIVSFLFFYIFDISANIMSLGGVAIAVGIMIDSSVVMIENMHVHIAQLRQKLGENFIFTSDHYWSCAKEASYELAGGLFWSMMIVIISFLPVFALPEQSGRMFIPLTLTKTIAMGVSSFFAIFLLPILVGYFVRGKIKPMEQNPVALFFVNIYRPILTWALNNKNITLMVTGISFISLFIPLFGIPNFSNSYFIKPIGQEFMPPLEEGDILYMPTTNPGVSISKIREILITTDKMIRSFPEVKTVTGKSGRAETATDPAPLSMLETTIILKDRSKWRKGMTLERLVEEMDKKVRLPGLINSWTLPIQNRVDMLSTGIKTPLGIKILGNDLATLNRIAQDLEKKLVEVEGISSVFGEKAFGGNYIVYDIDRYKAGTYGLNIKDIQDTLMLGLGGSQITEIIVDQYRWSANLRYLRSYRDSLEKLKSIYIPLPNGKGQIPISLIANIRIEKGPDMIRTENARKTTWLYIDARTSDIGRLAQKIEKQMNTLIANKEIEWPVGYSYILSGQYEQIKLASDRMMFLIPLVIFIIFLVLYLHFGTFVDSAWILFTTLLIAPIGGLWFMYWMSYNHSIASDVGFISLVGVGAETGIIMLVYLNNGFKDISSTTNYSLPLLRETILSSALVRVRPVMMTILTDVFAMTPLFWGDEPGNSAMRRIAAPMVGGMSTALVATMILLPVFFEMYYSRVGVRTK